MQLLLVGWAILLAVEELFDPGFHDCEGVSFVFSLFFLFFILNFFLFPFSLERGSGATGGESHTSIGFGFMGLDLLVEGRIRFEWRKGTFSTSFVMAVSHPGCL